MIGTETPRYYDSTDVGNKKLPSVTTITGVFDKPFLIPWAINTAVADAVSKLTPRQKYTPTEIKKAILASKYAYKEVSEHACNVGTKAHEFIEIFFKEQRLADLDGPEQQQCANAFLSWYNANNVEMIDMEVAIEGVGYAGRLDAVFSIDGVVTLVDFKTSKGFYDTYPMQLAAYVQAYNTNVHHTGSGQLIEACGVLRLCKTTGEYEYRDYTCEFVKSLAEFMSAAIFWNVHRDQDVTTAIQQAELLLSTLKRME